MTGQYKPGERLTLKQLAAASGISEMPVREAVRRLIAEGAIEVCSTRIVRVPLMTVARMKELRDIRMDLESLAVSYAAESCTPESIAALRKINSEIEAARARGNHAVDMKKVREFHYTLYALAERPYLTRILDGVWMLTGPYLNLLFPDYAASGRGASFRSQLISALESHNVELARACIRSDISTALSYSIGLADESGVIRSAGAPRRKPQTRQRSPRR